MREAVWMPLGNPFARCIICSSWAALILDSRWRAAVSNEHTGWTSCPKTHHQPWCPRARGWAALDWLGALTSRVAPTNRHNFAEPTVRYKQSIEIWHGCILTVSWWRHNLWDRIIKHAVYFVSENICLTWTSLTFNEGFFFELLRCVRRLRYIIYIFIYFKCMIYYWNEMTSSRWMGLRACIAAAHSQSLPLRLLSTRD